MNTEIGNRRSGLRKRNLVGRVPMSDLPHHLPSHIFGSKIEAKKAINDNDKEKKGKGYHAYISDRFLSALLGG